MRIEALHLERYGAFESRTVDLSGPGLIVIHGPNEAGKSTCLTAIGDFLYGIHPTSPLGTFGYDAMRIGATLRTAAGERLSLQRRKGRAKTLMDDAGVAHDDSLLARLLGATDRDRFNQLFGLDHEGLRGGGERLLAADGEIGRLIVEAGGGLRHLMGRLDELDAEASRLFTANRSKDRAFYQGLDAFTDAESRLRDASLSRDTYETVRKTRDQAEIHLQALRTEQRERVAEVSRLERLIRVAPLIAQLLPVEATLAGFADVAGLAEDFHARWVNVRRTHQEAEEKVEEARSAHGQLAARVEGLAVDPRLGGLALDINDLGERAVLIAQQRRDRPNRVRELADEEAKLVGLRERLKATDAKALAARLPPEEAVEAVQQLALEAISRRSSRQQAEARIREMADAVAALTAAIASAVDAGHGKAWGVEVSAFAGLAAQTAALAPRARQIELGREAVTKDLEALGFTNLADLRAVSRPQASAIQAEVTACEQLETERTRQVVALAEAQAARASAESDIERLRQGAEVATAAALSAAREARKATWTPIRDAYLDGTLGTEADRAQEVERFEERQLDADGLADRRITEAQRVAALAEAEHRRSEAQAAFAAAETAGQTLGETLAARHAAFATAFPAATARHRELPALAAFVMAADDLLGRVADLDGQKADLERQQADLQPSLELLAAAETVSGLSANASAALGVRISAVTGAISDHAQARTDLARRREDLTRAEAGLKAQERGLAVSKAAEHAWNGQWVGPLAALGAAPSTAPEAAAALANQWATARGVLSSVAQTRRRIERMDEDESALASRVARLAAEFTLAVPADTLDAASVLVAHWKAQDAVRADRAALEPELTQLHLRLEGAERTSEGARSALANLAREAGLALPDPDALKARADRAHERDAHVDARRQLLGQVGTAADGLDLVDLRSQQGGRDTDALKGDLAEVRSRLAEVESESESAIRNAQAARLELAGYDDAHDANRALADRETATARMHATLERYVEVRLARELVAAAIARVRATQQDPLVRRAGELFRAMTQGRFSGIETDVDDKGVPVVVGRRANGGVASVAAMSDGSRDQLFLAFRLASLEVYCRATEPLPFVADDILVHFDDARGAATLDLLATFAQTTQVLLFTHHDSVRDVAQRLAAQGRASLVELAQVS